MDEKTRKRHEYNTNWTAKKMDRINLAVPKGLASPIRAAADAAGLSMSRYILYAVARQMDMDGRPLPPPYIPPDPPAGGGQQ